MRSLFVTALLLFVSVQAYAHEPFELIEGYYELPTDSEGLIKKLKIESIGNGAYLLTDLCVEYIQSECFSIEPTVLRYVEELHAYRARSVEIVFSYISTPNKCTRNQNQFVVHQSDETGKIHLQFNIASYPRYVRNLGCQLPGDYKWRTQLDPLIRVSED